MARQRRPPSVIWPKGGSAERPEAVSMSTLNDLIDLDTTAIVVVDMQNDFCHPEGACGKGGMSVDTIQAMIPQMRGFLAGSRDVGANLIFIQCIHENATDSAVWMFRRKGQSGQICRKGTWGADFIGDGIAPQGEEPVVLKHRYSAFIGTRLESVLRTMGIKTLVMTGVGTNVCVESTARDGFMLDYNIVFLSDCTATASPGIAHEATLQNMKDHFGTVATSDDVLAVWRATVPEPALT
jgi:ureidoacrylate peracid hydrolase